MARVRAGYGTGYSGKVGGIVYVQAGGQEILRMVQVRSKNSWSDRQKQHRARFKVINDYCRKNKYLIRLIWNLASESGHGYNLFLKANSPAFALDGELAYPDKLHFSAGMIPLPPIFNANRSAGDPTKIEVSWTDETYLANHHMYDELMMVTGSVGHFTKPIATGVLRKNGEALLDLPAGYESVPGIWLFFRSNKMDEYSADQWFGIE